MSALSAGSPRSRQAAQNHASHRPTTRGPGHVSAPVLRSTGHVSVNSCILTAARLPSCPRSSSTTLAAHSPAAVPTSTPQHTRAPRSPPSALRHHRCGRAITLPRQLHCQPPPGYFHRRARRHCHPFVHIRAGPAASGVGPRRPPVAPYTRRRLLSDAWTAAAAGRASEARCSRGRVQVGRRRAAAVSATRPGNASNGWPDDRRRGFWGRRW